MAKIIIFFLFISSILTLTSSKITEDQGVWVLTDNNFQEALALQPNILIKFHAPWCGHCKNLAPEYSKAAEKLLKKDPPIHIGKVDTTENPKLAEKYEIKSYPTLKYFLSDEEIDYTGERTAEAIYSYVLKKSLPSVVVSEAGRNIEVYLEDNKVNVLLFGQKGSKEFELFERVSKTVEGVGFFLATTAELAQKYGASEGDVVLLKTFDEMRSDFKGALDFEGLVSWINKARVPSVIEFNDEAIDFIFQGLNPVLVLFTDKYQGFKEDFEKLAKLNTGVISFCKADLGVQGDREFAEFLGVADEPQPLVFIFDPNNDFSKHKLQETPTYESIEKFVKGWTEKKLAQFYKSQKVPIESHAKGVRVLVGNNFKEVVMDESLDVLVSFHTPWCGQCKKLTQELERLSSELKEYESIVVAKIDHAANDVEGFKTQTYPTIVFYPANDKKGIYYEGDKDLAGLLKFIKENSHLESDEIEKIDL